MSFWLESSSNFVDFEEILQLDSMSSGDLSDRDRGRRRKKKSTGKEHEPIAVEKTPIILAKPSAEKARASSVDTTAVRLATRPSSSSVPQEMKMSEPQNIPNVRTRILKPREERRVSPGTSSTPSLTIFTTPSNRESVEEVGSPRPSTPKIQIQQKSLAGQSAERPQQVEMTLEAKLAPYPAMKNCVKLVDESMQWCENAIEFLQDNSDFLVIGVIGLQGSGKSTIMSLLENDRASKSELRYVVFKPQSHEQQEIGEHCTKGIDICVTNQRTILLDVQPVLSASVMDQMIQREKKYPNEYTSTENALEIQSLQIAAFLLTVCHVVVIVQDWFVDVNLLRFLQTAEMLRPPTPLISGDSDLSEVVEYYPHIVFLQNKCHVMDFLPSHVKLMQDTYESIFAKSKLKCKSGVGTKLGDLIPSLGKDTLGPDPVNIFLIPWKEADTDIGKIALDGYKGHPGFSKMITAFRHQLSAISRIPMTNANLSEKNWFHYAARTWEMVKKFNHFGEYSRILP